MSITLYLDDSERRKLDIALLFSGLGLSAYCQDRINAAYFAQLENPGWKLPDFKTVGIEYHTGFEASEDEKARWRWAAKEKGVSRAKWCRLRLMQLVQADIDSGYSCPKSRMGETASGQEEKDAINREKGVRELKLDRTTWIRYERSARAENLSLEEWITKHLEKYTK